MSAESTEIDDQMRAWFTEEEIDEWRKVFKQFDKNGNGRIDANELGLVFQEMGLQKTEEEIQQCLFEADLDGNGEMDVNEFLGMIARKIQSCSTREMTQDEVINSLKVFTDDDGNMELSILTHHLTHLGDCPLDIQEVHELFDMMNLDTLINTTVHLESFVTEVMNLRFTFNV